MDDKKNTPWQMDEFKIYLRDALFLVLVVLFSIFIAEGFLLGGNTALVDRIFSYLMIFIPLGTLNLIAHYYYRNRRIRLTGNLRSSLRYRLSLAFMLVSVIPSIPIFFISSNVVERLVQDFFRIDVEEAMASADSLISHYRFEYRRNFVASVGHHAESIIGEREFDPASAQKLYGERVLLAGRDYLGVFSSNRTLFESEDIFHGGRLPKFEPDDTGIPGARVSLGGKHYLFYRFEAEDHDRFAIVGSRPHAGLEGNLRNFERVYSRFQGESEWRYRVPATLRLGLGLVYIFMICMALVMALFIARQISLPIVSLAAATRAVTDGHLGTRLDIKAAGEMGILIESFNQMTQELTSLRATLLHSQRVAAWQEVARRLAHEIKNPLTPIQLSAERMIRWLDRPERGEPRKVIRRGAVTIMEQVKVLRDMVQEFANFARMPEARLQPHSLDNIVKEVVHLFRDTSNVLISTRLSGRLPPIPLDKNVIIGMINNLLKNAVEAVLSVPEGRSPEVLVSTMLQRTGGRRYVVLKVEDSGPGVEEDLLDRIFEPYYTTKGEHGNGLGLALVERGVLEHGARIYVGRSSVLGGAEFQIRFRPDTD